MAPRTRRTKSGETSARSGDVIPKSHEAVEMDTTEDTPRIAPKKLQRSMKRKDFFADEESLFSAKSKLVKEDLNVNIPVNHRDTNPRDPRHVS